MGQGTPRTRPDGPVAAALVARHPEARRRLGDAARRTVVARYSLEAMLQKLEELYLDLWRRGNPI